MTCSSPAISHRASTASGLLTTTTQAFFGFSGIGAFVAATFAGLFVGTFFLGFLADRFGRRAIFTFACLAYTAASIVMACQTTSNGVLLWRFIAGIGIGVEIITIDAYITELVPSWMRGRAFAVNQAVMFIAVPVVAALAWWLVPIAPYGIDGWRWVVLIGAAGSMVIWILRLYVPESPLWLARNGRTEEADRILRRLEVSAATAATRPAAAPKIASSMAAGRAATTAGYADLLKPPYLSLVMLVHDVQSLPGVRGLRFCQLGSGAAGREGHHGDEEPAIFLHHRLRLSDRAACSPRALPTGFERKWIICGAALAISIFGMAFSQLTEPAFLIASGVLITASNMTMSYAYHAYQTEVFPTAIRARAAGLVYSMSRVSATFSGFIVAFVLREAGVGGVFGLITTAMIVVVLAIAIWGPAVRGRPLDA